MPLLDHILQEPSYGWKNEQGELNIPSKRTILREAFHRVNIFRSKKNWVSFLGWFIILCMMPFFYFFVTRYFSWPLVLVMAFYALIVMGTHGTIWYHRYCTHKAYKFSHPIWRFFTQHLVVRTIPEETYAISHHVHHAKSDLPGDPYNSRAGLMYCLFADVNHQSISKDLSEKDYYRTVGMLKHSGIATNNYKQYLKWGSIVRPYYAILSWIFNWAFWYGVLFLIGGHALACAIFSAAMLWFMLVRVFNYTGHGKGKEKHIQGIDFDRSNLAVNQTRPGLFTGEWHNNHHLYPGSARAGFLPYQLDLAWIYIYVMHKLGAVSSYHDSKKEFMKKYYAVQRHRLPPQRAPEQATVSNPHLS